MGWKYEVSTWLKGDGDWDSYYQYVPSYQGESLIKAISAMRKARKAHPGHAVQLVIR